VFKECFLTLLKQDIFPKAGAKVLLFFEICK